MAARGVVCALLLGWACAVQGASVARRAAACTISVNDDLADPQALLLRADAASATDHRDAIWQPALDSPDTVELAVADVVRAACPGGTVVVGGVNTGQVTLDVTCIGPQQFVDASGGAHTSFRTVTCSRVPQHVAQYSGATCGRAGQYREIVIGFEVAGRLIEHMRTCFDAEAQHVRLSSYRVPATIDGYQVGYPRPDFVQGTGFYDLGGQKLDTLYTQARQRTTINALLGLPADDTTYVQTNDYYLARGHLAAKADYLYGAQQRLTFYFVNVAPQWQTANGGNWNTIEENVRDLAARLNRDLAVHTGTHGVATLPHATSGAATELHLYVDGARRGVPVPALYYKAVHEPATRRAVVLVTYNNPYAAVDDPALHICADVCASVDWLTWKPADAKAGISYCCEVTAALRDVLGDLPDFDASGGLLTG